MADVLKPISSDSVQVKPSEIVDKGIKLFLDVVTPRTGGDDSIFMKGWRAVESGFSRADKEIEVRNHLRKWDNQFPEIHHERIVRLLSGAVVSLVVTSIYDGVKPRSRR